MKTCPRCNATFDDDQRFCPTDGVTLRQDLARAIGPDAVISGRYVIIRELGRGGMGVVYLAREIKLGRSCALKVLKRDAFDDVEAIARFYREATSASRINHPNVVTVYSFDETEDGLTYLAMEYVAGESLAQRLHRVTVLSPQATARIVWWIAQALTAAHDLEIVHRDLTPRNVMLTRSGDWNDFVKVVDFGIAKAFGSAATTGITSEARQIGTPEYMSPEQFVTHDVDHRSDLFSLALLATRMLAGGVPGGRSRSLSEGSEILETMPTDDWPPALIDVLARGLAFRAVDRYQSATAFASAFVRAISTWEPRDHGVREPWEAGLDFEPAGRANAADKASDPSASQPLEPSVNPAAAPAARSPARRARYALRYAAGIALVAGAASAVALLAPDTGVGPPTIEPADSTGSPTGADTVVDGPGGEPEGGADPPVPESTRIPQPPPQPVQDAATGARERLEGLIDLSNPHADSIRLAVDLADSLLALPLSEPARIEVLYRHAEASLILGRASVACESLRDVLPAARRAGILVASIRDFIDRNCRPPDPASSSNEQVPAGAGFLPAASFAVGVRLEPFLQQ